MPRPDLHALTDRLPVSDARAWAKAADLAARGSCLRHELAALDVERSGIEQHEGRRYPVIALAGGPTLAGRSPTQAERALFRRWRRHLPDALCEEAFQVAIDVINRYQYPHNRPDLTPPCERSRRRGFHPQHRETIADLTDRSAEERRRLAERFATGPGEHLLDVGAYLGFGVVRWAREAGPQARIVAVEADADTRWLLQRNLDLNGIDQVQVVPRAIWHRSGEHLHLHTGGRQQNSLVASTVTATGGTDVETAAVDDLVAGPLDGAVDAVSLTVNGAEVEALDGMAATLAADRPLRVSLAGWYQRDGRRIADLVTPRLRAAGLDVAVTPGGGVLAWR